MSENSERIPNSSLKRRQVENPINQISELSKAALDKLAYIGQNGSSGTKFPNRLYKCVRPPGLFADIRILCNPN
ncbi:hypothetical protein RCL_jg1762.t1 [Rhizophagus clarus]|uniref:Uncharacterized protein n=1 Tax=Rhizophagus clarus TaxID=94130 RepID=A0A8H3QMC3_9GLOM|nr:hypothetical protein RCL_jg1762.t1 [Rhizophagus clarus]